MSSVKKAQAKVKVYGYEGCSSCKKAMEYLDSEGIEYESVEIVECPPTKSELKRMLEIVGGNLKKLFNTSGQVYREMNLGEKLGKLSEADALELLATNGKLVKRPFALSQSTGAVGFQENEWKKRFG